jgi:hypothetical protein
MEWTSFTSFLAVKTSARRCLRHLMKLLVVVGTELRTREPNRVGRLHHVVAQVSVPSFGKRALLSLKLPRLMAPPEVSPQNFARDSSRSNLLTSPISETMPAVKTGPRPGMVASVWGGAAESSVAMAFSTPVAGEPLQRLVALVEVTFGRQPAETQSVGDDHSVGPVVLAYVAG